MAKLEFEGVIRVDPIIPPIGSGHHSQRFAARLLWLYRRDGETGQMLSPVPEALTQEATGHDEAEARSRYTHKLENWVKEQGGIRL